jgi:hypothetical protein
MSSTFKAVVACLCISAASLLSPTASAQTSAGPAPITTLNGGWASDELSFSTGLPIANPANCSNSDLYDVSASNGGYKTFLAIALTAVSSGLKVTVIVHNSNCSGTSRPLVIGLSINP